MSNKVSIIITRFTDFDRDGKELADSWGIRVCDDYDASYDNLKFASLDDLLSTTDAELVEIARNINERAAAIIDFARESKEGIEIGDRWVTWAEIDASTTPAA